LVGARAELSMAPLNPILASSLIGSTLIYDFAPQQTAAPDIRQTSGSWLVEEADMHLKDLIFNPLPSLKSSFSAEVARSVRNPNSFGKALIDNMEGIKDDTSVSMSKLGWQIASNPSAKGGTFLNAIGQVNLVNQVGEQPHQLAHPNAGHQSECRRAVRRSNTGPDHQLRPHAFFGSLDRNRAQPERRRFFSKALCGNVDAG